MTGREARIKWPNDVLLDGRKVAGILLESHQRQVPGFVVVGIGLNVLQQEADFAPEIRERAGSLAMAAERGCEWGREGVAAAVLGRLEVHYRAWPEGFAAVMGACERRGCRQPER